MNDLVLEVSQDPDFARRYELTGRLGEGGMGTVHRGTHRLLGRPVAIKFMRPEFLLEEVPRQRFLSEARTAAGLIHPNVCVVLDFGFAGRVPFLVTELVEGQSLQNMMLRAQPGLIEPALVIAILREILEGLGAIHGLGVVHRDLKPANILVTRDNRAKILDFGLAKPYANQPGVSGVTLAGTVVGTPAYISPEQATAGALAPSSDLYALAVICYELVVGHLPFRSQSAQDVIKMHVYDPPHLPDRLLAPVRALLARGLAKRPRDRYQTAAELRFDLDAVEAAVEVTRGFVTPETPALVEPPTDPGDPDLIAGQLEAAKRSAARTVPVRPPPAAVSGTAVQASAARVAATGASAHGASQGAPAHGASAHGAPAHGASAHGASAHGAPAHGASAHGAPTQGGAPHGAAPPTGPTAPLSRPVVGDQTMAALAVTPARPWPFLELGVGALVLLAGLWLTAPRNQPPAPPPASGSAAPAPRTWFAQLALLRKEVARGELSDFNRGVANLRRFQADPPDATENAELDELLLGALEVACRTTPSPPPRAPPTGDYLAFFAECAPALKAVRHGVLAEAVHRADIPALHPGSALDFLRGAALAAAALSGQDLAEAARDLRACAAAHRDHFLNAWSAELLAELHTAAGDAPGAERWRMAARTAHVDERFPQLTQYRRTVTFHIATQLAHNAGLHEPLIRALAQ